jgi:hypothetical protein
MLEDHNKYFIDIAKREYIEDRIPWWEFEDAIDHIQKGDGNSENFPYLPHRSLRLERINDIVYSDTQREIESNLVTIRFLINYIFTNKGAAGSVLFSFILFFLIQIL